MGKTGVSTQCGINLVIRAISDLNAEGYFIKIKDLVDYTGLSRSVFAKPHIREPLVSQGIVKGEKTADVPRDSKSGASRASTLRDKLRQKDARIVALTSENEALQDECFIERALVPSDAADGNAKFQ